MSVIALSNQGVDELLYYVCSLTALQKIQGKVHIKGFQSKVENLVWQKTAGLRATFDSLAFYRAIIQSFHQKIGRKSSDNFDNFWMYLSFSYLSAQSGACTASAAAWAAKHKATKCEAAPMLLLAFRDLQLCQEHA